jgi:DNA-nicking Smr family endonuclease
MNQLDLHGTKHAEVQKKLDDFLWENMQRGNETASVITGISDEMKKIVRDIAAEYGMTCENDWSNPGKIIINLV